MIVPIAITLATLASYAAGWVMGVPLVLPVLNTLASIPFMVAALSRGDHLEFLQKKYDQLKAGRWNPDPKK